VKTPEKKEKEIVIRSSSEKKVLLELLDDIKIKSFEGKNKIPKEFRADLKNIKKKK
jgi:hypothetical protein